MTVIIRSDNLSFPIMILRLTATLYYDKCHNILIALDLYSSI